MAFIKDFKQITKKSVLEAGGKGASLGEMTNAGIPVPPGFVLLSSAFDRFLEETDLKTEVLARLAEINHKDVNSVDKASNEIRDAIGRAKMPPDLDKAILAEFNKLGAKLVAVRSSATAEDSKVASWAGELETYLNTNQKRLLLNVQKCWSSLFTTRAIFYGHEKGFYKSLKSLKSATTSSSPPPRLKRTGNSSLRGRGVGMGVSVAVVVQAMVQSEISGICFTVHPVTEDRSQLLIEAGFGLGEAIVSGSITPDSYVVDKTNTALLEINVAEQSKQLVKAPNGNKWIQVKKSQRDLQKLSGRQILELARICMSVEKHYGFPCDIEWAFAAGKFYITQSRPITTLKK